MLALSIRQPWAWLILHAGKDIENRSWSTKFRGRVLVHAAKGMTKREYEDVGEFLYSCSLPKSDMLLPEFADLERGGIIGSVEIADCVEDSDSPWFFGTFGFVLREPRPLPFTPWKGQLGFFDVPDSALPSRCIYPDCSCDGPGFDGGCGMFLTDGGKALAQGKTKERCLD